MANLVGYGTLTQIAGNTVWVLLDGTSVETTYTPTIDPNFIPGVSRVAVFDDGSVVRQAGDPLADTD